MEVPSSRSVGSAAMPSLSWSSSSSCSRLRRLAVILAALLSVCEGGSCGGGGGCIVPPSASVVVAFSVLPPPPPSSPSSSSGCRRWRRSQPASLPTALRLASEVGGSGSDQDNNNKKRTHYEVLGCPPSATREELKRSYLTLAKRCHPDANIGKSPDELVDVGTELEFSDVATAWKVLSVPRERIRYDRALRAEALTAAAERSIEDAAPRVRAVIEKVAVPLFRRGAATAVASVQAVAEDLTGANRGKRKDAKEGDGQDGAGSGRGRGGMDGADWGSAIESAVRAGRKAGIAIDRLELLEKSKELENRAREETERAVELKVELSAVMDERLNLALRTPGSDLTSLDAVKILDGFNSVDRVSIVESLVMMRRTVATEIKGLEEVEGGYAAWVEEAGRIETEYQERTKAMRQAEANAEAVAEAEKRAMEALVAARELVQMSDRAMADCTKALAITEAARKRTAAEAEGMATALEKTRERVRRALIRKEEVLRAEAKKKGQEFGGGIRLDGKRVEQRGLAEEATARKGSSPLFTNGGSDSSGGGDEEDGREKIKGLLREERYLVAESARLEDRATRMRARARDLMVRAQGLKKGDDNGKGDRNGKRSG